MGLFHRKPPGNSTEPHFVSVPSHGPHDPPIVCRAETRPDVIVRLEALDDVIFAAIDGDATALEAAAEAWQSAISELGHDALEESRRQYVRHAQSVWDALRRQSIQPPHRIFAAIEIIGLLVNHEQ
jgi:hypothetical protein